MLVIRLILGNKIGHSTLIFDEIDQGISGVTADLVGNL